MTKASDNVFPKLILDGVTSAPAAPSNDNWKMYAMPDGIYARSSNTTVGPFGSGSVSYGSNATQVSFTPSAGASSLVSRADHVHNAAVGRGFGCQTANTTVSSGGTAATLDITTIDDDDDDWHWTDTTAITGTVTKTASSVTLTGSGTSFTTELHPGSVISVPGTATEILAVRSIESNTSLTLWAVPANTASGQTATRKREYFVVPEGKTGRYLWSVAAVIGTEATPTYNAQGFLAQQTNSVTIASVGGASNSPSANSNGNTAAMLRRRTFTQGEIYMLRAANNNDANVTVQVTFTVTRVG